MLKRWLVIPALFLSAVALQGCSQTPYREQVRTDASNRVAIVNAQLQYDQAKQAFEVGQFAKATREINAAIATYPEAAPYYLLQGRIFLETHRLEAAIKAFNTAIEKNPTMPEPHYFSGIVHQRWSDAESAGVSYSRAFELDSSNVQYLTAAAESHIALNRLDEAQAMVEERLAYFEHNAALRHLLGQIALLKNDPSTAARLFSEARLLNPTDVTLLEELARAQFDARLFGKCYETVRELQNLSKDSRPELMLLEARCLTHMDRLAEARNKYLDLTRINPSETAIWIELGSVAWELGDFRRVAAASVRVIALAPDRHEGYMLKGINELHNGNNREAIGLFQQAADRAGNAAMPHLLLGQALEGTGDFGGALNAYGRAAKLQPGNAEAQSRFSRLSSNREIAIGSQQGPEGR